MYELPSYVWALALTGVIGIPAVTSVVMYRGALASGVGRGAAVSVTVATAAVLGGWLVVSGLLASADAYHQQSGEAASWFGVAFSAFLISLLLASRIPLVSRILDDPGTPARLALPHTLRVVGVVFLIVMAQGDLPAVFALPAGLGDIAIGISAPFVARRLARDHDYKGAIRFNLLGILDLVVALSIGFLAGLGPYRPLDVVPSTEALSLLPLALVPTVAVPLAIALHIVSLSRLRTAMTRDHRAERLLPADG